MLSGRGLGVPSSAWKASSTGDSLALLARKLVEGNDVELWHLDRRIETFGHTSEPPIMR